VRIQIRLKIVPAIGGPQHPGRNPIGFILDDSSIAESGILAWARNVAVDVCSARATIKTFIDSRPAADMIESGLALSHVRRRRPDPGAIGFDWVAASRSGVPWLISWPR